MQRSALLCVAALAALSCCGTPEKSGDPCVVEALENQARDRFPVGSTFYLPRFDDEASACSDLAWVLEDAPRDNDNEIVFGEDGYARFTPHGEGTYRFGASGGREVVLEVIDTDEVPFYNLNLYPTNAVEVVDGEVWVANVMRPTLTVLDAGSLDALATIPVGSWPVAVEAVPGSDLMLVAQRDGDTLGVVDRKHRRIVDAIWVGDEPASVVVHPDGARAYVSLPYQAQIAVVDVEARAVTEYLDAGPDVTAMALSPSGDTLYAASHRSGHPQRFPYGEDSPDLERDIVVFDTASLRETRVLQDVGTTIRRLAVSPDGTTLYATSLRNETETSIADERTANFIYEVRSWDAVSGSALANADLARQPSAPAPVVTPNGMAFADGLLWVASEGSDALLALDPATLEEQFRVDVEGRPRAVATDGETLFVHGHQSSLVTAVGTDGVAIGTGVTSEDPRPPLVATGQAVFTGEGQTYGRFWSCNSCHVEGLTDTLVWNAGPVVDRVVPRPFFWEQGTYPLGWAGYLSNVENYAYTVTGNIGLRPNTTQATSLGAYLGSIMPPSAATHLTARDGALSSEAAPGKDLFEKHCAQCHELPLTTTRFVLPEGITEGVSDIPALVGAYRHGVWLKTGEALTLRDAVDKAVDFVDAGLSDEEIDQLTRYVMELTGRDFFALRSGPLPNAVHGVEQAITIDFSLPVWNDPENLRRVVLVDGEGKEVEVERRLAARDHRHLVLEPRAPLEYDASYEVEIQGDFEAHDQTQVFEKASIPFETGARPGQALEGEYLLVVYTPTLDPIEGEWDEDNTTPARMRITATPTASGADVVVDYGLDLVRELHVVVDGDTIRLPPLPIPVGPSFADFRPSPSPFTPDAKTGEKGTFSGPGFEIGDVVWELQRPAEPGECAEGNEGVLDVSTSIDRNGRMVIEWGTQSSDQGLAVWVTDPEATIPTGPDPVVGGDTYWSVSHPGAPDEGFDGPVVYGVTPEGAVEDTDKHGMSFRPLVVGECYKVSVATTAFEVGAQILRWDP